MSAACAALLLLLGAVVPVSATPDRGSRAVIGAYYGNWFSAAEPISAIPSDTPITHLFYAFSTIEDGRCVLNAPTAAKDFADIADLKRRKPGLKALISVGGWGAGGFSDAALTRASRSAFVASCVDRFFTRAPGVFDGVDVDWEFPVYGGPAEITDRPEDKRNMTLLVREFRRQLDRGALVTAALPTGRLQTDGPYDPARSFELGALGRELDFITLMTYDMGTGFSPVATFNAPLREVREDPMPAADRRWNNVTGAVDYYLRHGVPARKLVLGTPFYGRGFQVRQEGPDHGLYQPYESAFWVDGWDEVQRLKATPGWREHWHPVARSPWLYNAAERKFVSFENPRSIGIRAQYAKQRGLRGTFMWELGHDDAEHSLLDAMSKPFR
ncbi:putative chitinase [Saccharothrix espanaensis DSM 44229]|uniref:chitinase n=1 Tax=Saccharothrix espanaensis (strain ATCC 51144 / DSM 44229 / JCM 9112 / NBRC 15066 / NRRL 15764) TaxID=1179773 RepID=K0KFJ1_SACES|nr:putative chitinase [Saccharothrix espanaensis DSM 44229]